MKAKKIISVFMSFIMAASTASLAYAANDVNEPEYLWSVEESNTIPKTTYRFKGEGWSDGVIREMPQGEIGKDDYPVFPWSEKIGSLDRISVIMTSTVSDYAFYNPETDICDEHCYGRGEGVRYITIGTDVKKIGKSAFEGLRGPYRLVYVYSDSELEVIDDRAFANSCVYAEAVHEPLKLPRSVKIIGDSAFENTKHLYYIDFPDNLKSVGKNAFRNSSVYSAYINENIEYIGDNAFTGSEVRTIYNPSLTVSAIEGSTNLDSKLTVHCYKHSAEEAVCKARGINIEYIGDETKCGDNAFWSYDKNTKTLTISGSGDMWNFTEEIAVGPETNFCNTFRGWGGICNEVEHIVIEDGIIKIGQHSFEGMRNVSDVIISDSVTEVSDRAFLNCISLEEIIIPDSVRFIGERAFDNCINVKNLELGKGLERIGNFGFSGLINVENDSIDLYEGLTEIGEGAITVPNMKKLTIPSTVQTIGAGNWGFYLEEVINKSDTAVLPLEDISTNYSSASFYDYYIDFMKILYLHDIFGDVDELEAYAEAIKTLNDKYGISVSGINSLVVFIDALSMKSLRTSLHVTCYKDSAQHEQCIQLGLSHTLLDGQCDEETAQPEKLTHGQCGENAFWDYDENSKTLTISGSGDIIDRKFTLSESSYNMDYRELYKNTAENIIIGDEITRIGECAFLEMSSVRNVTIGKSVETIGSHAFGKLCNVKSFEMPASVREIEYGAFCDCYNAEFILNEGLETVRNNAFGNCFNANITLPSTVTECTAFNCTTDNSRIVNNSKTAVVIDEEILDDTIADILYMPKLFIERFQQLSEYIFDNAAGTLTIEENTRLENEFIEAYNEENGTSFENVVQYLGSAQKGAAEGVDAFEYFTIECLSDSAQHEQCKKLNIPHAIIGDTCCTECGSHPGAKEYNYEPTCTENGYKGGKVCEYCLERATNDEEEKAAVIVAPEIIPPTGHKEKTVNGIQPTCTEIGFTDSVVCEVCDETISVPTIIPPTGHTDKNNDGVCDSCGAEIDGFKPQPKPQSFGDRIISVFKGIVDSILALFRKLFG